MQQFNKVIKNLQEELKKEVLANRHEIYRKHHQLWANKNLNYALTISEMALKEAYDHNNISNQLCASNSMYTYQYYLGQKQNSLAGYKSILKVAIENQNHKFAAIIYNNLSNVTSNYKSKSKYLLKAIEFSKKANRKDFTAHLLKNIGELNKQFSKLKSNNQKYYLEAISLFKELNLIEDLADCRACLGGYYTNINKVAKAKKELDKAKKIAKNLNSKRLTATINIFETERLIKIKKYRKAILNNKETILILEKVNYPKLYWCYFTNGRCYFKLKDFDTAKSNLNKAKEFANKLDEQAILKLNKTLQKIAKKQNNLEELFALTKENIEIQGKKESGATLNSELEKLNLKFENIIAELKNNELTSKVLRSQMNPHFIFNSLNSIQNFVVKNKSTEAVKYISKFATLMRQALTNSEEKRIKLEDEIAFLENYLFLEKLRFKNAFDYTIAVDENIEAGFVFIPPMLIQPFVENSIVHGLKSRKKGGRIDLTFSKSVKESNLVCIIKDNGIGIKKTTANSKHKSLGTKITKDRIINLANGKPVAVKITDLKSESEQGTKIELNVPLIF